MSFEEEVFWKIEIKVILMKTRDLAQVFSL